MSQENKSPATTKMVKIKTIRDIKLKDGRQIQPHKEVEIPEDEAKLFCDTKYELNYSGWGEGHYEKTTLARAVRL